MSSTSVYVVYAQVRMVIEVQLKIFQFHLVGRKSIWILIVLLNSVFVFLGYIQMYNTMEAQRMGTG